VNIADHAITAAESPALIMSDAGVVSFGELYAKSQRVAAALHGAGLRRGDGVALVLPNRPEFFEITWGCQLSGLYYTAVNTHFTPDEVAYVIDDSDAKAVFVDASMGDLAAHLRATDAAVDVHHLGQHPAAERALVDEAQRRAVVEHRSDPQVVGVRHLAEPHLAAHPEVDDERGPLRHGEPQVFSAPTRVRDDLPDQPGGQVCRAGLVPADGPQMVDVDGGDLSAGDMGGQSAPDGLDLRQLRHCRGRSTPRRRPSARPLSWTARHRTRTRCPSRSPSR